MKGAQVVASMYHISAAASSASSFTACLLYSPHEFEHQNIDRDSSDDGVRDSTVQLSSASRIGKVWERRWRRAVVSRSSSCSSNISSSSSEQSHSGRLSLSIGVLSFHLVLVVFFQAQTNFSKFDTRQTKIKRVCVRSAEQWYKRDNRFHCGILLSLCKFVCWQCTHSGPHFSRWASTEWIHWPH